ncbi:fucolectin-like [Lithobates pipiens]
MMRMIFLHTATILAILYGVSAQCKNYRNFALRGRATQSTIINSVWYGFYSAAINAIDGNKDPNFYHGSCSHTAWEPSPWWRVDLLKPYKIAYITITNRGDCCSERLNGAEILVGNSLGNNGNNNARCGLITSIPAGAAHRYYCNGMVGRYANVVLRGKSKCLQLCEVQVWTTDRH